MTALQVWIAAIILLVLNGFLLFSGYIVGLAGILIAVGMVGWFYILRFSQQQMKAAAKQAGAREPRLRPSPTGKKGGVKDLKPGLRQAGKTEAKLSGVKDKRPPINLLSVYLNLLPIAFLKKTYPFLLLAGLGILFAGQLWIHSGFFVLGIIGYIFAFIIIGLSALSLVESPWERETAGSERALKTAPSKDHQTDSMFYLGIFLSYYFVTLLILIKQPDNFLGLLFSLLSVFFFASWIYFSQPFTGSWGSKKSSARKKLLGHEGIAFLAIMVFAFLLRAYRLCTVPAAFYYNNDIPSLNIAANIMAQIQSPFGLVLGTINTCFYTLLLPLSKIFVADPLVVTRFAMLVCGMGSILALYLLVRELFDAKTAFWGSFLISISLLHLHLSRIWQPLMPAMFFSLVTLYFFYRTYRATGILPVILGGLALGFLVLSFPPAATCLVLAVLMMLYVYFFDPFSFRDKVNRMALLCMLGVVMATPVLAYMLNHWVEFSGAFKQSTIVGLPFKEWVPAYFRNIGFYVSIFTFKALAPAVNFYLPNPGAPLLDTLSFGFCLLGLFYGLFRIYQMRYIVLLGGGFVTFLTLCLLNNSDPSYGILLVPMFCALGGVGVSKIEECLARFFPQGKKAVFALLVLCLILAAGFNAKKYFVDYGKTSFNQFNTWPDVVAARQIERSLDLKERVISDWVGSPIVNSALYPRTMEAFQPSLHLPIQTPVLSNVSFYFRPPTAMVFSSENFLPFLRYFYPGGKEEKFAEKGVALYSSYKVPKDQVMAIQGLTASYFKKGDEKPYWVKKEMGVSLTNTASLIQGSIGLVRWSGSFFSQQGGTYLFSLVMKGQGRVLVDGQKVAGGSNSAVKSLDGKIDITTGAHHLEVVYAPVAGGEVSVYWTEPGGGKALIPGERLCTMAAPPFGATGFYYPNTDFRGSPAFEKADLMLTTPWAGILPFKKPFSVAWKGLLQIKQAGNYKFYLKSVHPASLTINNIKIITKTSKGPGEAAAAVALKNGQYPFLLRYQQLDTDANKGLELSWETPEGIRDYIPVDQITH